MAFEKIKRFASEKMSGISENMRDIGGEMADKAIKVAGVANEWRKDLTESIKLKTIDKWKLNFSRDKENWLLERKDKDITKTKGRISRLDSKVEEREKSKTAEEAKFDKVAENTSDEFLKELFTKSKANKSREFDDEIIKLKDRIKSKKTALEGRVATFETQKSQYQENIKNIESKMSGKIDEKIIRIKEKFGIDDKLEKKEKLKNAISPIKEETTKLESKLNEYKKALEMKKSFTKEDYKKLKEMTKAIEKELKKKKQNLNRLERAQGKVDRQIGSVNKKVGKWENLKDKYKLAKEEATDSSIETDDTEKSTEAADEKETTDAEEDSETKEEELEEEEEGEDEAKKEEAKKSSEIEGELEKEEVMEISNEITKYSKLINIEKLRQHLPKIKSRLEKLGANQIGSPLEMAYKYLAKDSDSEEKIRKNMEFVNKAIQKFKELT